jgi:hypothetical protein
VLPKHITPAGGEKRQFSAVITLALDGRMRVDIYSSTQTKKWSLINALPTRGKRSTLLIYPHVLAGPLIINSDEPLIRKHLFLSREKGLSLTLIFP